ncbi:MAG: hypothetical protein DRH56_06170 [Deltaproteobacteria bacterium]|nr:MAG: hypothetical protein DRH56_06170 [Deltaproteobacteria bacterium]
MKQPTEFREPALLDGSGFSGENAAHVLSEDQPPFKGPGPEFFIPNRTSTGGIRNARSSTGRQGDLRG